MSAALTKTAQDDLGADVQLQWRLGWDQPCDLALIKTSQS